MKDINYAESHIETKLSNIGAKVLKATEMADAASSLLKNAKQKLPSCMNRLRIFWLNNKNPLYP